MKRITVACIQMDAQDRVAANLRTAIRLASGAVRRGAQIVVFPELFHFRGPKARYGYVAEEETGPSVECFQEFAQKKQVSVVLGSVLEKTRRKGKYHNTCVFISENGKIVGKYRKMHLFHAVFPGKFTAREADDIVAGRRPLVVDLAGIKVGAAICNDIRFPELFQALRRRGAQIVFVAADFTRHTGQAHWEVLLRARAIENQLFVVAANQVGKNRSTGIESFGHSMIIDPWGKVLGRLGRKSGILVRTLDLARLHEIRSFLRLK